ncbi:hypothetical protein NXS19_008436 [Fusarium pseudograminearum]|nr:hypothetical protein NXS19_008436 [Fusarium pseudograminearum]
MGPPYLTPLSYAKDLQSKIDRKKPLDIFAIGGHVQDEASGNSNVTIRWEGHPTLRLPLTDDTAQLNAPITMDIDNFCTNFDLGAHGILGTINQSLARSLAQRSSLGWQAFRAELCKLNVHSASSDLSQTLVNTPASIGQIATLVVCLPVAHKGGKLTVREKDQQVEFDWASGPSHMIQWAAFFDICELETLPITEGHRLTLTYNLFWADYVPGLMADQLNLVDQQSLYFYKSLEKLIDAMKSTEKEHLVGFTCRHAYPHTSRSSHENLHKMLKGMDMVVYQALKQILGHVTVGTVVDDSEFVKKQFETEEEERESGRAYYELDNSYLVDTVCITETPVSVMAGQPRHKEWDDYDPTAANPTNIAHRHRRESEYRREKVNWLNHAPDEQTPKEVSDIYCEPWQRYVDITEYESSAVIFAWVNKVVSTEVVSTEDDYEEEESGNIEDDEVESESGNTEDYDGWNEVFD